MSIIGAPLRLDCIEEWAMALDREFSVIGPESTRGSLRNSPTALLAV